MALGVGHPFPHPLTLETKRHPRKQRDPICSLWPWIRLALIVGLTSNHGLLHRPLCTSTTAIIRHRADYLQRSSLDIISQSDDRPACKNLREQLTHGESHERRLSLCSRAIFRVMESGARPRPVAAIGSPGYMPLTMTVADGNATVQTDWTASGFIGHPNVLVCTDVLKESVDLHLFCDEVVHYGVAWTSDNLEQRIGRVDRFGSQISRQIAAFRPSAEPKGAPRLQVKFPYLDGTLDAPQVARVILAKVRSDLRMDMKRHHDDMGKICLDDLLNPNRDVVPMNATPMRAVLFPDDRMPRDADGVRPQPPERIASLLGHSLNAHGVHFPRLNTLRQRGELPQDLKPAHPLLRTVTVPKRRNRCTSQAESAGGRRVKLSSGRSRRHTARSRPRKRRRVGRRSRLPVRFGMEYAGLHCLGRPPTRGYAR